MSSYPFLKLIHPSHYDPICALYFASSITPCSILSRQKVLFIVNCKPYVAHLRVNISRFKIEITLIIIAMLQ